MSSQNKADSRAPVIAVRPSGHFWREQEKYLKSIGVEVRLLDLISNVDLEELFKCEAYICSFTHDSDSESRFVPDCLEALDRAGVYVIPSRGSRFGFDNKASQAFMFEALGIPSPKTWVFWDHDRAERFLPSLEYPVVFKLAKGASSQNVKLVENQKQARKFLGGMFGRGINSRPLVPRFKAAAKSHRASGLSFKAVRRLARGALRLLRSSFRPESRERGYVLYQQFIPGNDVDYRVTVIGERAFTFMRRVRKGDFRASGGGKIVYPDRGEISVDMVRLAFKVASLLKAECLAMDMVKDHSSGDFLVLEVSYSFLPQPVADCPGHFDQSLTWVNGSVRPEHCIASDALKVVHGRCGGHSELGVESIPGR